jgi:hypothetical protein
LLDGLDMAALHEIEVELFRNQPELARELLEICAGIDVGHGSAETGSADLTQVASAEFRADAITIIRDAQRRPVAAIVVEIQRSRAPRKKYSWPVYVTGLRAKLQCPVTLLVFAPEPVARWARKAIEIGHPGFCLRPVVIGPADVPRITDPSAVTPELLVLSAIGHPDPSLIGPLTAVLGSTDDEAWRVYLTLIVKAWPLHLSKQLEAAMRPELEAALKKVGYQAGVRHGREEGRLDGLQQAALVLARQRGALSPELEARVLATTDHDTLTTLVTALGAAENLEAARAALAAL